MYIRLAVAQCAFTAMTVPLAAPLCAQVPAPAISGANIEAQASGIFINQDGDVLTARHAVSHCKSLYVLKDGRVAEATIRAIPANLDLAVLHTDLKPYLSATFSQSGVKRAGSVGVFTEAYNVLQHMPDRGKALSNALTVPGEDGLQMLSGARPGASGSAVLSADGLVLGVVVERVAAGPTGGDSMALSQAATARATNGSTRVKAVPVTDVTRFLQDNGIPFTESDAAQLGPMQSPASRAATLAVGILCG
jgi:hypothetical protein